MQSGEYFQTVTARDPLGLEKNIKRMDIFLAAGPTYPLGAHFVKLVNL